MPTLTKTTIQVAEAQLIREGVCSAIGQTPLVRLTRVIENSSLKVFAKLEAANPGGSIKDRAALSIIDQGICTGVIKKGTVVIESSSGNMGIGLAQVCSYYGLRFICVIDPKTSSQNIRLLEVYGAQVELITEPDPTTGDFLQARLNRVHALLDFYDNSFWPDQYSNSYNSAAHHKTMDEIVTELGDIDYLLCATSTCGTMRGCAEYVRKHRLRTQIIAVDAVGSVIFSNKRSKRLIPGHGAGIVPELYQPDLASRCIHISDLDCVVGCRRLIRREAILAGGSSGAVTMALDRIKEELPKGSTCVLIFPDRGERYLDTIYSDLWVQSTLEKSHISGGLHER